MKVGLKGTVSAGLIEEVWCGGTRVREVWANGEQYFSDAASLARGFVLRETGDEMSYWAHVTHAMRNKLSGALVTMELNGQMFHAVQGNGSVPVLEYKEGAFMLPSEIELRADDILGKDVTIVAKIPSVTQYETGLDGVKNAGSEQKIFQNLPILTSSVFYCTSSYLSSRLGGASLTINLESPSEGQFFSGSTGFANATMNHSIALKASPTIDASCIVGMYLTYSANGGYLLSSRFVYPAFEKTFVLKIMKTI